MSEPVGLPPLEALRSIATHSGDPGSRWVAQQALGAARAGDGLLREARLWQLALAKSIQGAGITDDHEEAWSMAANVKGQLDSRGVVLAVAALAVEGSER